MNNRYSRQELFLGSEAQANVTRCHVWLLLVQGHLDRLVQKCWQEQGVGTLTMVDRDYVEWSNLQRQQLYREEDVRKKLPKAIAAKQRLQQINSEITINSLVADVNGLNIEEIVKDHSVIVRCYR